MIHRPASASIPYKLIAEGNEMLFHWMCLGDIKFTDPFFEDTLLKCRRLPHNARGISSICSLDALIQNTDGSSSVHPSAFIFHTSRCGSTLLAQLLSLSERCIVLSEVPLIDQILRMPYTYGFTDIHKQEQALYAVIRRLGCKKSGQEEHLFIKLDSWHLFFYEKLRRLFPGIPFILMYRKPDAILLSQQKRRGIQFVPGLLEPAFSGLDPARLSSMPVSVYMVRMLERLFEALVQISINDDCCMLMNYREEGMSLLQEVMDFTGIVFDKKETEAMAIRAGFHSKYPEHVFNTGSENFLFDEDLQRLNDLYGKLEALRMQEK